MPKKRVKHIVRCILQGLDDAHKRRVIHRDLKPQNILIEKDHVKIADFGLARTFTKKQKPFTNGVQSLFYRAPEIILGEDMYDTGVDVWSVGCILGELLSGKIMFQGNNELS